MKKYFSKYLTVDGEIKEGDKVRQPLKDGGYKISTRLKENDPQWGQITEEEGHIPIQAEGETGAFYTHPKHLQKVKLFLCSRDIQVGSEEKIGLISPDAKWVKEGDEFTEEQVKLMYINKGSHSPVWFQSFVGVNDEQNKERFDIMATIQCDKCETFH